MQYCNKMKEYKYEQLSDESFKRCSGAPLLQKENLSPYSTAITPFQQIHLKYKAKNVDMSLTALV